MYTFLYFLIMTGFIFSKGFFSFGGVVAMLLATLLFPLVLWGKLKLKSEIITPPALLVVLTVFCVIVYGGLYQQNIILIVVSYMLLVLNILLAVKFAYFSEDKGKTDKAKIFIFLLFIAILLRLFMILSSPNPYIDVFDYLKNGALGFLQGQNPYSMTYTKLYTNFTPNYYGYLPGMLFLTLPFVAILNDPRYAIVFAETFAAIIIYKLSKNKINGYLYSLLFINNPISLYMVEQSYTEPLILLLLAVFAWCFVHKKNYLSVFTLGLLLATKQYAILLIPLLFRLITPARQCLAKLISAFFVAGIIILPFFLWNKADFIHDAVTLQLNFPPRYEGLSFFSFLYRFGISYNFILSAVIIGVFLLFVYTRNLRNLSQFFFLSSFTFFVFFFFNKWAFINYYYLVSQLLLVGGILKENKL